MYYLFEQLFLILLIAFAIGMVIGWLNGERQQSSRKGD